MKWHEKVYALYRGGENVCDGTIPEIAEKTGATIDTLKWMTTVTAAKRIAERGTKNPTVLVPIKDEDTLLMTLKFSDRSIDVLKDAGISTVKDLIKLSEDDVMKLHPNKKVGAEVMRYRDYFMDETEDEEVEQTRTG